MRTLLSNLLATLLLLCGFLVTSASADTFTIEDEFIGGGYSNTYAHNDGDVITGNDPNEAIQAGYIDEFDIDSMIVDIDTETGTITISIVTDYVNGTAFTTYGDLFISTDGWDFDTTSTDTIYNTETDWEYVFDTDTETIYNLAKVSDDALLESDDVISSTTSTSYYRTDQLVLIDADELKRRDIAGFGDFDDTTDDALLIYTFDLEDLGLSLDESFELAFSWAMTCANDVIVGTIEWQPVPEPGTMALLGFGLLGFAAAARRKASALKLDSQKSQG